MKYELLSPAGYFPQLHAAIDAGADAVYFGLEGFNMRAGAKNFSFRDLKKIKKICSEKGVKKYLTLNTIVYDSELGKVEKIISKLAREKLVDAVICWDFAVVNLCKKYKIPFHISTQASVANSSSVEFYKKLGAERVVFARELDLKKIKKISKKFPDLTVECFAHGAMCVAVSGRCFTSQFLHNLSANRGECAHPCRRSWIVRDDSGKELKLENNRVMSAKDLCVLPFIDKLKKAGVKSFKIEGRNRSPEYVYTVTKVYRKALDNKLSKEEVKEGLEELKNVYNRGFSSGFYLGLPTKEDFSDSENGEQKERKIYLGRVEKFWPRAGVVSVKVHNSKISLNDEVYLIGKDSGVKRFKVESLEIENKKVSSAKKGFEVALKIPIGVKAKKNDEIFLIKS